MQIFYGFEQYRPRTIQDCILPDQQKKTFLEFLKKKEIPNMLLSGTAGTVRLPLLVLYVMNLTLITLSSMVQMKVGILIH